MDLISSQIQHQPDLASNQKTAKGGKGAINEIKNKNIREIQLHKASEQLEATFLTQIVKAMEKTVPKNGLSGQQNTLSSMLFSSTMGDALAKGNPTGLAKMFYQALAEKDHGPISAESELKELDFSAIHALRMDLFRDSH